MRPALPLALLVFLCSASSGAQSGQQTTAESVEADTARQLFREGRELYKKLQIKEAHAKFLAAWALLKKWQIAANLGGTEMLLGRYRDAATHLTWAERESAGAPEDDAIQWVRAYLPEAKKHVAALSVRGDAGLEVAIDDKVVGTTPMADPVFLDPGSHKVEARSAGRTAMQRWIDVSAGESRELLLARSDEALPAAPRVPQPVDNPSPKGDGLEPRTVVLLSGGALSVIAAGLGVYFSAQSASASSDVDRLKATVKGQLGDPDAPSGVGPGCSAGGEACRQLQEAIDDRASAAGHAQVAFVTGAVLGAATAATWLLWPSRHSAAASRNFRIAAEGRPNGGSIVLQGHF